MEPADYLTYGIFARVEKVELERMADKYNAEDPLRALDHIRETVMALCPPPSALENGRTVKPLEPVSSSAATSANPYALSPRWVRHVAEARKRYADMESIQPSLLTDIGPAGAAPRSFTSKPAVSSSVANLQSEPPHPPIDRSGISLLRSELAALLEPITEELRQGAQRSREERDDAAHDRRLNNLLQAGFDGEVAGFITNTIAALQDSNGPLEDMEILHDYLCSVAHSGPGSRRFPCIRDAFFSVGMGGGCGDPDCNFLHVGQAQYDECMDQLLDILSKARTAAAGTNKVAEVAAAQIGSVFHRSLLPSSRDRVVSGKIRYEESQGLGQYASSPKVRFSPPSAEAKLPLDRAPYQPGLPSSSSSGGNHNQQQAHSSRTNVSGAGGNTSQQASFPKRSGWGGAGGNSNQPSSFSNRAEAGATGGNSFGRPGAGASGGNTNYQTSSSRPPSGNYQTPYGPPAGARSERRLPFSPGSGLSSFSDNGDGEDSQIAHGALLDNQELAEGDPHDRSLN